MGKEGTVTYSSHRRGASGHFCSLDTVPCVQTPLWSGLVFAWTQQSCRMALSAAVCIRVSVHQENAKA